VIEIASVMLEVQRENQSRRWLWGGVWRRVGNGCLTLARSRLRFGLIGGCRTSLSLPAANQEKAA